MTNDPMNRLMANFSKGNFDVTAEEIFGKKADAEDKYDITIAPLPTVDLLNEAVREVATQRAGYALISSMLGARRKQFDEANRDLIAQVKTLGESLSDAESVAKEIAIALYKPGDDKKLAPGVGIRETKVIAYDDKKAFDWALDHKLFIALDVKPFEAYAKKTPPDFVTMETKITATPATDLDAALKDSQ